MVVAGAGQDKAVTNTLVEWAGVGINLESRQPGVEKIRNAVAEILNDDGIRQKVSAISEEYRNYDLSEVLDQTVQNIVRDWEANKCP
jgi:UDP:flavonoid glycosyltransferase YjiC (YdhE family)